MTTQKHPFTSAAILLLSIAVLTGACSKQPAPTPQQAETPAPHDPGIQVGIVPDADMIFYLDLADMRSTPILKAIEARREALDKASPGKMSEEEWAQIKELTGLEQDDLTALVVSADLDTFDSQKIRMQKAINNLSAACSIALAKALPYETVVECMRVMSSRSAKTRLEELTLEGYPAVRVIPSSTKEPTIYAAVSQTEKTLFIAFNETAMTGMLQRDADNKPATPHPDLTRTGAAIPETAQLRLLVVANDAMRGKIGERIDALSDSNPQQQQTQMGILAGFISPLRNTQNLSFFMNAADQLDMRFSMELGNASESQQCAHLIQSFVMPMLLKSFETTDPDNTLQVDDSLDVTNEENALVFTLTVTEQDVKNWNQPTP